MAATPDAADEPGDGHPTLPVLIAAPRPDRPRLEWSDQAQGSGRLESPERAEPSDPVEPVGPAGAVAVPRAPTVDGPPPVAMAPTGDTAALPRTGRPAPQHRAARPATPRPRARGARRLRDPIGSWRRIRAGIELLVMTVVLGVLLAAVLAAAIGAIVVALQHALNG